MERLEKRSSRTLRGAIAGTLVWAALALGGCSVNPTTGRSQFNMLSMQEEISLGESAKASLTDEYGGSIKDPRLNAYMSGIGRALAAQTEGDYPNLPWEFTLLDSDVINAFALPGGKVFMSRGLAEKFTTEAELAAVLGHEVGHVTARHSGQRVSQSMVVSGIVIGAGVAAGQSDSDLVKIGVPLLVGAGGGGYLLKFNRTQELEADALGVRYMVRCGYDPLGARMVQEVLAREGGKASQPEFLLTHPYPESRIAAINKMLAGEYAYTQNNPDYGLFADRYRTEFLEPMAKLRSARTQQSESEARLAAAALNQRIAAVSRLAPRAPGGRLMLTPDALHDSASWCAHCAGTMPEPGVGP
ncbi:MAG: M48 family metallopeptidase [Phycisphaeraceae bacterium]|nr:MAG: M48 family metallopeptidase [Phycisphaeraceae bacterium]